MVSPNVEKTIETEFDEALEIIKRIYKYRSRNGIVDIQEKAKDFLEKIGKLDETDAEE